MGLVINSSSFSLAFKYKSLKLKKQVVPLQMSMLFPPLGENNIDIIRYDRR